MIWVLALSLMTNPSGHYEKTFSSESECVAEMKNLIKNNLDNNIESVACFVE
jgi:hypothetical protein